uniref:CSON006739 protein n=1 Tax=Culicoides sonorensis TaxID=179676 RepID=A0A336KGN6_CULSO
MSLFVHRRAKIIKERQQNSKAGSYYEKIGVAKKTSLPIPKFQVAPFTVFESKMNNFNYFITIINNDKSPRYVTAVIDSQIAGWKLEAIHIPNSKVVPFVSENNSFDIEFEEGGTSLLKIGFEPICDESHGREVKLIIDFNCNPDTDKESSVKVMEMTLKGWSKGIEVIDLTFLKFIEAYDDQHKIKFDIN